MLKKEIRVIGIDDGPFFQFRTGKVLIIGTIFRGGLCMEGVITTTAKVDGDDATQKIANMIMHSRFKQVQCIFLGGITVGGFNVVDLKKLFQLTKIPVIAVIRKKPDVEKIHRTLHDLGMQKQLRVMHGLPIPTKIGKVYVQYVGISSERAKEFLRITTTRADIPEPLRAAHLIAAGIVKGESRGRA